ncbi:hypothetical protein HK104_010834 [Borealophlyctis nickersoniae]|nr:hypothetical protein HK104_010834 [Borealophlyctis nickersoniae]
MSQSQPTRKDLEETLRTTKPCASSGLNPRRILYSPNFGAGGLSPLAAHLLWTKKKEKGFANVEERRDYDWPYIRLDDLLRRDDEDVVDVVHTIAHHFAYDRTEQGQVVISNIFKDFSFKEYYIAEVLLTHHQKLVRLSDTDMDPDPNAPSTGRKRRKNNPIPRLSDLEEDPDLHEVKRNILIELRKRNGTYPKREREPEQDPHLVPYLQDNGTWPDRVEDLMHPDDVDRAKWQIGLKGAGWDVVGGPPLGVKEVPALADFELYEYDGSEEVRVDLKLEDFTLGVGM